MTLDVHGGCLTKVTKNIHTKFVGNSSTGTHTTTRGGVLGVVLDHHSTLSTVSWSTRAVTVQRSTLNIISRGWIVRMVGGAYSPGVFLRKSLLDLKRIDFIDGGGSKGCGLLHGDRLRLSGNTHVEFGEDTSSGLEVFAKQTHKQTGRHSYIRICKHVG